MTHEDEVASKAVRKATLKSLKLKKKLRVQQIKEEANQKIRELDIKYAEDPERLKAKYAAEEFARNEKQRKRSEKRIAKEKKYLQEKTRRRQYTIAEEIFSSIVQGIGACIYIAATVFFNLYSIKNVPDNFQTAYIAIFSTFGGLMSLSYIMSILHHALTSYSAKEVFRRLCHISIFLIIACVYTAFAFPSIRDLYSMILLLSIWTISLAGIIIYAIAGSRLELLNMILYALLGWAGLLFCKQILQIVQKNSFGFLIASGVIYTIGLVLCSIRKIKYMHAFGDLAMLFASINLFFSLFYMY